MKLSVQERSKKTPMMNSRKASCFVASLVERESAAHLPHLLQDGVWNLLAVMVMMPLREIAGAVTFFVRGLDLGIFEAPGALQLTVGVTDRVLVQFEQVTKVRCAVVSLSVDIVHHTIFQGFLVELTLKNLLLNRSWKKIQ